MNTVRAGRLAINVADVSGGSNGIHVEANGAGDMIVASSGTVTGAQYGMQISNSISGNLTITSTGQVTGIGWDAISATNSIGTGDLVINRGGPEFWTSPPTI
ncbi:hypothetical protein GCM10019059_45400 [Camelimonas fluminis]|uniref:Uncharacterized protein n=1 Tax=Camelimonas fluminis TaxID=1576911 RepID=A0ABV7UBE0_9HYPH|nr:hypothetical protein [Camelimonas fluminis]GHE83992.1 hypothetical protein GCM10019059_45400 [Camelimonas fluminis]